MRDGRGPVSLQALCVDLLVAKLSTSAAVAADDSDLWWPALPRALTHSLLARAVATGRAQLARWLMRSYPACVLDAGQLACNDQRLVGHNPALSDGELVRRFLEAQRLWDAPIEFPAPPRPLPVQRLVAVFLDCVTRWKRKMSLRQLDLTWYEPIPVERANALARRLLVMAHADADEDSGVGGNDWPCFSVRVVIDCNWESMPLRGFSTGSSCMRLLELQRRRPQLPCQLHIVGYLNGDGGDAAPHDTIGPAKWPLRVLQCQRLAGVASCGLTNKLELLMLSGDARGGGGDTCTVGGSCVAPFVRHLVDASGDLTDGCAAGVTSFSGSLDQLHVLSACQLPQLRYVQLAAASRWHATAAARLRRHASCLCSAHVPQLLVLSVDLSTADIASCEAVLRALPNCRRLQVLECSLPRGSWADVSTAVKLLCDTVRHASATLHTLVVRDSDELYMLDLAHYLFDGGLRPLVILC